MSGGLPRRAFLASGASLAGAGWATALASRAAAASAPAPRKNLALRRSAFLPLLGQNFRIAHARGSLIVVLHQVSDLDPTAKSGAEDQFSLIFTRRGLRPALSQGTYPVSHPWHGQISLFVVPVDRSPTTQHYQAIIDSQSRPRRQD